MEHGGEATDRFGAGRGIRFGAHADRMDARFETAAVRGGGLIRAADLRDLGVPSSAAHHLVARGELVRVRTGGFAARVDWEAADPDARHRLLVRATDASSRRPLVVSHHSAAAMHRLPRMGAWPEIVTVFDPNRNGGHRTSHVSVRRAGPPADTVVIDGVVCTSLIRTLVDLARSEPITVSLPMLDHALARPHAGITVDRLRAELERAGPVHGRRRAETAIGLADPDSGSPGESFSRARVFELGFELPELQVAFRLEGGTAVVDFYWRGIRLIGEFDGRIKYSRSLALSGTDASTVVHAEKRREDGLRRLGERVVRWDWPTVRDPRRFQRLLAEFGVPVRS